MPDEVQDGNSPNDARPLASPSSDAADAEPQQASAYGSNLEALIAEAEAKVVPSPQATFFTSSPIPDLGPLPPVDAELLDLPLVDIDGVTHDGRVLTPSPQATFFTPRFGTLAKTISEMSMQELKDYVNQYKELVRQAERALDFRRVVLGASQLEVSQRKDTEQRKLRADKTRYAVKTVSLDPKTGKQVKKSASAADMTKMLQMLTALAELRKKKESGH